MAPMRVASPFLVILFLLTSFQAALALRFDYYPGGTPGAPNLLSASGTVRLGDEERFMAALHAMPAGIHLAGLLLDSPGGDLEEGLRLAAAIKTARLPTMVGNGSKCASACFILFVAGAHMSASTGALVGVHSASYGGRDDIVAQAATLTMARRLGEYGVPEAILGKMVTAHPSQIWWLNRSDLESMRVDTAVPAIPAHPAAPLEETTAAVQAQTSTVKTGFHVEPAAHGYHVAAPAKGFQVWRPQ